MHAIPDTLPAKFNPAVSTAGSNSLPFYSTFGRVLFLDNFRSLIASLSHAKRTQFDEKKKIEKKEGERFDKLQQNIL